MKVPLAVVGLSSSDVNSAIEVLISGKLTMGDKVREFEESLARYLGVDHFVMVNSGSSANLLVFESLLRPSRGKPRLQKGDGVLVPSVAWPTTIWPIIQLGLVPIFVDVNRNTVEIDLEKAALCIEKAQFPIRAIFPIHPLGFGIDHKDLEFFAKRYSLILINDVCESLGSWNSGIHAGTTGLAATFSFYFSHHITTMEGGGIATNDSVLADDLRSMRAHGWSRDRSDSSDWNANLNKSDAKFRFITTGYNFRPTEVQAAIGINQISRIDEFVSRRREIVKSVSAACNSGPLKVLGREFLAGESSSRHAWMLIPIKIDCSIISRAKVIEILEDSGIETRPVLTGNFLRQPAMELYSSRVNADDYEVADWIAENCIVIGCHHDFTEAQVQHLVKVLSTI